MSGTPAYVRPGTLGEACGFLWERGSTTRLLAGGTDLLIEMREGELRAGYLMDISRLPELGGVALSERGLTVGAGVTLTEIHDSDLIGRYAPALRKAACAFASRQIRNTATIGGNVGNASPSADTAPPLLVHEAVAVLASVNGEREVPVEELFTGPYKNAVRPEELIVRFVLKPCGGSYSDFQKIGRRASLAVARMNMAVLVDRDDERRVTRARVALGSSTPTPMRIREAEAFLRGVRLDRDVIAQGAVLVARTMIAVSGRRPSTVYKEKAAQGLFIRMLSAMV